MSAQLKVGISLTVQGLGRGTEVKDAWTSATAPSEAIHSEYLTQTTADTEQALYVGDATSPLAILIRAVVGNVTIDTSFDTTYSPEILVLEGTSVLFVPTGTVYFSNDDTLSPGATVSIEYAFVGA